MEIISIEKNYCSHGTADQFKRLRFIETEFDKYKYKKKWIVLPVAGCLYEIIFVFIVIKFRGRW